MPRYIFQYRERSDTGRPRISHDFNVVADAVVRLVLYLVYIPQAAQHVMVWAAGK